MSSPSQATLGLDFGTSNSALACFDGRGPARLLPLEGTHGTLPTALFFDAEERSTHFGRDAIERYLAGAEGRLMRSLKSLLGSPLVQERTEVNGQAMSFQEIITLFLHELRRRAGQSLGTAPERVVIGRPVHFVDDDGERDARAQATLREAAQAAGFREIAFQLEPIAAAFDYERRVESDSVVLIVDIGGGTSDFTVVRLGPGRMRPGADRAQDILATTGVHVGGTDFDRQLSLAQVMPLLGLRHLGPRGREVPSAVFFDLATWHLINWRYAPRALHEARELRTLYADERLHARLMTVLTERLGHRLAATVEAGKIACSQSGAAAPLDFGSVEPGLAAGIDAAVLREQLAELLGRVVQCARDCCAQAGLSRDGAGLQAIYLTGGSSALAPLREALAQAFPGVPLAEGDLFGSVAAGLAYSAP